MSAVVVAIGVALVLWSAGLGAFYAWLLHRRGESPRRALRVLRRPQLWLGVVLIVVAFSTVAAVGIIAAGLLVGIVVFARRGPRRGRGR
jgi:hypothetical protein